MGLIGGDYYGFKYFLEGVRIFFCFDFGEEVDVGEKCKNYKGFLLVVFGFWGLLFDRERCFFDIVL